MKLRFAFTFALALAVPRLVHADAIPPPPKCPPGKIAKVGHDSRCVDKRPSCQKPLVAIADGPGFTCVKPPPKNCPNGWRGETDPWKGPHCVVDECDSQACADGKTCIEHPVCLGWEDRRGGRRDVTIGICASDQEQPADRTCRHCGPSKICVKLGAPLTLSLGGPTVDPKPSPPIASASASSSSSSMPAIDTIDPIDAATSNASSQDAATSDVAPAPPPVTRSSSGCGGCDLGEASAADAIPLLVAVAFAFSIRRKKRAISDRS